jgi:hypothetical protein
MTRSSPAPRRRPPAPEPPDRTGLDLPRQRGAQRVARRVARDSVTRVLLRVEDDPATTDTSDLVGRQGAEGFGGQDELALERFHRDRISKRDAVEHARAIADIARARADPARRLRATEPFSRRSSAFAARHDPASRRIATVRDGRSWRAGRRSTLTRWSRRPPSGMLGRKEGACGSRCSRCSWSCRGRSR